MTQHEQQSGGRWPSLFWPGLVVSLLAGQIVLLSAMAYVAVSDPSFAVEPDYYQKGLHWDDAVAQRRQNETLGWNVQFDVGPPTGTLDARTLRCRVVDRNGAPLTDIAVTGVAFAHARGGQRYSFSLQPAGAGTMVTSCRFRRNGLWEFRLVVTRADKRFTYVDQRRLKPAGDANK